jgi:hypothetical protein
MESDPKEMERTIMRESIEHAIQTVTIIHLIGGSDTNADTLVEEIQAATDSEEMLRVVCTPEPLLKRSHPHECLTEPSSTTRISANFPRRCR